MQGYGLGNIDGDPEQCLQLRLQGNDVEEASIRFEVDQKVKVAFCSFLPTRHGTEDTDVACAVACGDLVDPIPLGLDSLLRSPPRPSCLLK